MGLNPAQAFADISANPQPVIFVLLFCVLVILGSSLVFFLVVVCAKKKVALDPEQWRRFELVEKSSLSHNVLRLKFALQSPTTVLGLPIGQHISIQGVDEAGKEFTRPYTPVSLDSDVGHVEFVIKIYPEGAMSKYLSKVQVGAQVAMRGPKGRFVYARNMVRHFGMIAGGTGITPMYQVARAILEDPKEKTRISLISANVTEDDILLKKELDAFAKEFEGLFSVHFVLNKPPEGWSGGVGFVSKDMIQAQMPAPADDVKVLYCGPPPMNKAMQGLLTDLGYTSDMIFKF